MWKIQQLSELYIEEPGAWETCSDSNGTKALGLKYSTPPLAYRSPRLSTASLLLSASLCFILPFPPNSLICCLLYSDGLFAYFPACSLCLSSSPYSPIAWAVPPPPRPASIRALTLSFYLVFAVNRDSQKSLGMLRDSKWGVKMQSTSFLFNKDIAICLQALMRWLINTSDLIISLRAAGRVFKTTLSPQPSNPCAAHSCSTMECSDQHHEVFQS